VKESLQDTGVGEDVILDETALSSLLRLVGSTENPDLNDIFESDAAKDLVRTAFGESFAALNTADREKILELAQNLRSSANSLQNNIIDIDSIPHQENTGMSKNETLYEIDLDDLSRAFKDALAEGGTSPEGQDEAYYQAEEAATMDNVDELLETAIRVELGDLDPDLINPEDLSVMLDVEEEEVDVDIEDEEDLDLDLPGGDLDIDVDSEVEFEEPLDEVFEIDENMLRQELSRMRQAMSEGEAKDMASAFGGGTILKEPLEFKDDDLNVHSENRQLRNALRKESRSSRALHGKLAEYRSAVQSLRGQLTEMNLFNAKLLYVNKLLQNSSVSPKRRRVVIEALDKARTLREVKLLYGSLTNSLESGKRGTVNESRRRSLGSSSRATTRASVAPDSMQEVDRWAVLAGINK
jgi:hypothetical protein